MSSLTLTIRQRLNLAGVIRSKRWTDIDDVMIFHDLLKKIDVPIETRKVCVKELPDGRVLTDDKAMAVIPSETYDLEKAETLKLRSRLQEWVKEQGLGVDDLEWFTPLMEQLKT